MSVARNKKEEASGSTALTVLRGRGEVEDVSGLIDFIRIEKDLVGLGFFTPTSTGKNGKLKSTRVKEMHLTTTGKQGEALQTCVKINAGGEYGLPGTADLDKWLAFMKIVNSIQRREGRITNPIGFTSWELFTVLGHSSDGRKNFDSITEWLNRMKATTIEITTTSLNKKQRKKEIRNLDVFSDRWSKGTEMPSGVIADKNYVWLSEWQLENLNRNYVIPVDFDCYRMLRKPIAKTLVPILQVGLYASRAEGFWEKDYSLMCQLLGIREWQGKYDITDQLSPSLDELRTLEYIAGWGVEKRKGGDGFKLVFRHGEKFKRDLELMRSRKREIGGPTSNGQQVEVGLVDGGEETERLIERLRAFGVNEGKAGELVKLHREATEVQIEALPYREGKPPKNAAGWLIAAIENNYTLPALYVEEQEKKQQAQRGGEQRSEIEGCDLCDANGWRRVKSEQYTNGAMKRCSHVREQESKYQSCD
jgi:hypothetical protein